MKKEKEAEIIEMPQAQPKPETAPEPMPPLTFDQMYESSKQNFEQAQAQLNYWRGVMDSLNSVKALKQ